MSMQLMDIVAGVIIAAYLGGITYALLAPTRQPDPQRGMAVGCLVICLVPGALLMIALLVGYFAEMPRLVSALFYLCVVPAAWLLINLAALPYRKHRVRRLARLDRSG